MYIVVAEDHAADAGGADVIGDIDADALFFKASKVLAKGSPVGLHVELIEGALIQLRKYNGNPIGLQLPIFVELKVAYTEAGVRGDSSSGSVTKPAKLETGAVVNVPLFINIGDKIRVDTRSDNYLERVK